MPLTATAVKQAKAREKPYKLSDEKGMFLLINPNGSKYWRFKYRFGGKEKLLALGVFPDLSLADARAKRDEARSQLAKDIDPSAANEPRPPNGSPDLACELLAARFIGCATISKSITARCHAKRSLRI